MMHNDSPLDLATWAVSAIAAINWGAAGVLDANLLTIAGLSGDTLTAAYLMIGAAGILNLYLLTEAVQ